MRPTRVLCVLMPLAVPFLSLALAGCYVQPATMSFPAVSYPASRPAGITNRASPNFYARRATPPGSVNYNNQNPYGGNQQPGYGSPPPPYPPYDPNAGYPNAGYPNAGYGNQYGGNPPPSYGNPSPPYNASPGYGNQYGGNPPPYDPNAGSGNQYGNYQGNGSGPYGSGNPIPSGPPCPSGNPQNCYGGSPSPPDNSGSGVVDNSGGGSGGSAQPVGGGQGTCAQGYVPRQASATDSVCVTPDTQAQTANDNSQASARVAGGGKIGRASC